MTPYDRANGTAEDAIVRRIHDAVIEQRLPPGTKLSEAALCEAFGVGRARVRRSLLVLAGREIVELHANRGAFVARPTAQEARDVFDARRDDRAGDRAAGAARARETDLRLLEEHMAAEAAAQRHSDRPAPDPALGAFPRDAGRDRRQPGAVAHGGRARDPHLAHHRHVRRAGTDSCRSGEHDRMLQAIRAHDEAGGARLMFEHLAHIEAGLDLSARRAEPVDVIAMFSPGA